MFNLNIFKCKYQQIIQNVENYKIYIFFKRFTFQMTDLKKMCNSVNIQEQYYCAK